METKVLIDYQEYQDLLDITEKYFELKKSLNRKETPALEPEEKTGQIGTGIDCEKNKDNLEEIVEKVLLKISQKKDTEESARERLLKGPSSMQEKAFEVRNFDIENLLKQIPFRDKKKARILLDSLTLLPSFDLNSSGEIKIDGVSYPGSNINKLLKCVFSPYIKGNLLIGRPQFLSFLEANGLGDMVKKKLCRPSKKGKEVEGPPKVSKDDCKWYCLG